jgi:hypothetical protein
MLGLLGSVPSTSTALTWNLCPGVRAMLMSACGAPASLR